MGRVNRMTAASYLDVPISNVDMVTEDREDSLEDRRCIGCGKFLRKDARWNQCSDCDTREPEER